MTWQKVVSGYSFVDSATNTFQVELFFDGRIRIAILDASQPFAAVGLSAGTNMPPDFSATDFSALGNCANVLPKLVVSAPAAATEGAGILVGAGTVRIPAPRPQNLIVNLSSGDTTELTVPASVTIPAGATSAVFTVTIIDDALRDGTKGVAITASAPFFQSGGCSVQVNDNETNVLSVAVSPSVAEGGITTYFRKRFTPPSGVQSLWLRVLRDDGVAVFLNGNEILRNNLAAAAAYNAPALNDVNGTSESTMVFGSAAATNLSVSGNAVAVEIHQSSPSSVDLSFDLELSAVVNLPPTVTLTAPPANALFLAPTNGLTQQFFRLVAP